MNASDVDEVLDTYMTSYILAEDMSNITLDDALALKAERRHPGHTHTMAEEAEIQELKGMLASSPARASTVTNCKFQRFLVQEGNSRSAQQLREAEDEWRRKREAQLTRHRQHGASLSQQGREQLSRDKQIAETVRTQNASKGSQMKSQLSNLKQAGQQQQKAWQEHGRQLSKACSEQQDRVRSLKGEGSKSNAEKTAKCKEESAESEAALALARDRILQENRAEVALIKEQTSDEVTNSAKAFSYQQRKEIAAATKAAEQLWKDTRQNHTNEFLGVANKHKDDVKSTRTKAKQMKEEVISVRQQQASAARSKQQLLQQQHKRMQEEDGMYAKSVHDSMYRGKYVNADAAAQLQQSGKYVW